MRGDVQERRLMVVEMQCEGHIPGCYFRIEKSDTRQGDRH